jgi:hypothetical protein
VSAIAGIIGGAEPPADAMARMVQAMVSRGPDGQAAAEGEGFLLAHGLLDTAGNGPAMGHLYKSEDIVVTADCRLDNRDELIQLLGSPAATSDTGLLADSYRRWGDDMPARLLGDFAFALWDLPSSSDGPGPFWRQAFFFLCRGEPFHLHFRYRRVAGVWLGIAEGSGGGDCGFPGDATATRGFDRIRAHPPVAAGAYWRI